MQQATTLCAGFRRLTLSSAAVDNTWQLGDRVLVSVDGHKHRTYTVCGLNRPRGTFDVLAVAHDRGPGGRWVTQAFEGDTISFFGPKPDLDVRTRGAERIVLLGDETTVGLFEAIRRERRGEATYLGAYEWGPSCPVVSSGLPALDGLTDMRRHPTRPGQRLQAWVERHIVPTPRTVYFVNGHGAAVRALRLRLLSMGIRGAAIRSRAFWGRG
ncbi:MAG: siderophore-interacting protein [Myxococcota bacterium]